MLSHYNIDCNQIPAGIEAKKVRVPMDDVSMAKFGRLILDLAIGAIQKPGSNADAVALLKGAGLQIDSSVNVELIFQTVNDIKILIPPKEMAERAICDMQEMDSNPVPGQKYVGLPSAYEEMLNDSWSQAGKTMEQFYEVRVADYTLGFCR